MHVGRANNCIFFSAYFKMGYTMRLRRGSHHSPARMHRLSMAKALARAFASSTCTTAHPKRRSYRFFPPAARDEGHQSRPPGPLRPVLPDGEKKPQLIVLSRGSVEENVLNACKSDSVSGSPAINDTSCWGVIRVCTLSCIDVANS